MFYKGKQGFNKEQVLALQKLEEKLSNEQIDFIIETGMGYSQEYGESRFLYEPTQISMLAKAFEEGFSMEQISAFAKPGYDAAQMMYPVIFCKDLSAAQIEQVMLGFEHGLNAKQISEYNDPSLEPKEMAKKRAELEEKRTAQIFKQKLEVALKQEPNKELLAGYLILNKNKPLQEALDDVNIKLSNQVVEQAISMIKDTNNLGDISTAFEGINYENSLDYIDKYIKNYNNILGPGDGGGPGGDEDPGDDGAPSMER